MLERVAHDLTFSNLPRLALFFTPHQAGAPHRKCQDQISDSQQADQRPGGGTKLHEQRNDPTDAQRNHHK